MNAFQTCRNTSDAVPFYLPQQLYLKPCATICISVQLSQKIIGKTIVHGEIIQKLKALIQPDEFARIAVTSTTIEVVRFEAELELRAYLQRVLSKLDNKSIKLKDITPLMKVRAGEVKGDFPSRHEWDAFFRDAKDMNEMKFGERPDTVHIARLPTQWFVPKAIANAQLPSEKIFYYAFEKFGPIRNVDIPVCDPYRCKMKPHISGMQTTTNLDDRTFFEAYVQFKEYLSFVDCMNALRGMHLVRRERDGTADCVKIFVTFDKSKHLSEAAMRRRDILRERLIVKQRTKEEQEENARALKEQEEFAEKQKNEELKNEKQRRRREREEKRKVKILAELKVTGSSDEINEKIAKEERKLLKVQRRLEAIRLVEELFKRVESKLTTSENCNAEPKDADRKSNELKKMRMDYELELQNQREKLHLAIEGRVLLRSIVSSTTKEVCGTKETSTSSEDSIGDPQRDAQKVYPSHPINAINDWCHPYWHNPLLAYSAPLPNFYHPRGGAPGYYFPTQRGRGFPGSASSSGSRRPFRARPRGNFNRQHSSSSHPLHRYSKSRSRSKSRSKSHKRYKYRSRSSSRSSRSSSRSRSRRHRSYSRQTSASRSRSQSRYTPRKSPQSKRSCSKARSGSSHSRS